MSSNFEFLENGLSAINHMESGMSSNFTSNMGPTNPSATSNATSTGSNSMGLAGGDSGPSELHLGPSWLHLAPSGP